MMNIIVQSSIRNAKKALLARCVDSVSLVNVATFKDFPDPPKEKGIFNNR